MDSPHEIDPNLVTSRSILWGDDGLDSGAAEAVHLDERQRALVGELQRRTRSDLELLVAELRELRTRRFVVPLWITGNGASGTKQLNAFPDRGEWCLESILAWADPAATAALQVNITLDASIPVPIPVALSKLAAASVFLAGLPVADADTIQWVSSGGVATDRGAVLLVFKRES